MGAEPAQPSKPAQPSELASDYTPPFVNLSATVPKDPDQLALSTWQLVGGTSLNKLATVRISLH